MAKVFFIWLLQLFRFNFKDFSNPLHSIYLMNFIHVLKLNLCFTMNLCSIFLWNSLRHQPNGVGHTRQKRWSQTRFGHFGEFLYSHLVGWILASIPSWNIPAYTEKWLKWHNIFPNSNQIYPVDGFIVNAISVSNIFSSPSANYGNQCCVSLAVYSLVRFLL